ncbi:MAG: hypothetical protein FJ280_12545 [Planctomycetes bacterium]|nr:hypothetical protein [Planctomycetota bacterium]
MRITEKEVIDQFLAMGAQYAPLTVISLTRETPIGAGVRAEVLIRFAIEGGPSFQALAEITVLGTPKTIQAKCLQVLGLATRAKDPELVPLIIASYIPPRQADILREAGVSWMDLSGNMVVQANHRVYIERTGRPNRFPDTAPIKKVFQGTASLVARALLLRPAGFASVSEITSFIKSRNGSITISTVSKVLRSLEEDLLVSKTDSGIFAGDRAKLLAQLAGSYAAWARSRCVRTSKFAAANTGQMLQDFCSLLGPTYVFCGFYAAELKGHAAGSQITLYVQDMGQVGQASERLGSGFLPDDEFGQVTVIETKDRTPWFNVQTTNGLWVVDDVELYLEMTIDTPRGPKIADLLRSQILQATE